MLFGCQSHQLSTTEHNASELALSAFMSSKLPSVEKHRRDICMVLTMQCPDAELLATKLLNNINRKNASANIAVLLLSNVSCCCTIEQ